MIAVTLSNNQIEIKELPVPQIKPDQVLIKVYTCGLNRSDLLETQGQSFGHAGGEHKIIGGEFAGKIVELGKSVNNFNIGDNVMCRGGSGWAEYAVGNFKRIVKLDTDRITWEQGASIQASLQTMHDAIVTNGKFVKGQTVFIQGATSGVGLIGLQIAKSLGASRVFGSSTNKIKLNKLEEYGADVLIDTSSDNWLDSDLSKEHTEVTFEDFTSLQCNVSLLNVDGATHDFRRDTDGVQFTDDWAWWHSSVLLLDNDVGWSDVAGLCCSASFCLL